MKSKIALRFLLLSSLWSITETYAQEDWSWEWGNMDKAVSPTSYFEKKIQISNGKGSFYEKLIWFYKRKVSPVMGKQCPCYPSCSTYTLYSMQKYGFFWGFIMGIDRLYLRENREIFLRTHYSTIRIEEKGKIYDLPEANYVFGNKDWRMVNPDFFYMFFNK